MSVCVFVCVAGVCCFSWSPLFVRVSCVRFAVLGLVYFFVCSFGFVYLCCLCVACGCRLVGSVCLFVCFRT